jgi:hypothetical protein
MFFSKNRNLHIDITPTEAILFNFYELKLNRTYNPGRQAGREIKKEQRLGCPFPERFSYSLFLTSFFRTLRTRGCWFSTIRFIAHVFRLELHLQLSPVVGQKIDFATAIKLTTFFCTVGGGGQQCQVMFVL